MTILTTDRLIIREMQMDDAQAMFDYTREPSFQQELPDEVLLSLKQAQAKIAHFIRWYQAKALPLVYAVELKATGEMIGHIELAKIHDGVEIGYAIAEAHRGNGFAAEMTGPFCDWAKQHLGVDVLYGLTKNANASSWKVLEHNGFQLERQEMRNFWGKQFLFRVYTY